ncbi:MAG: hypothetical protein ACYTGN_11480 [Planctomycetota bacterium]|jgi:hypothetical protein
MKRIYLATSVMAVAAALAFAAKNKPDDSVTYAKSWAAAVSEAKMLNLPIVVHCHGFG